MEVIGSVLGASIAADGAENAADIQAGATREANQVQREQYAQTRSDQTPYRQLGAGASSKIAQLLGLQGPANYDEARRRVMERARASNPDLSENWTPYDSDIEAESQRMGQPQGGDFGSLLRDFSMADFQADPSYQFRKDEGMKGLERSAAARGGLLSGAALKGLDRFNSDLASQEYGNAFTRNSQQKAQKYNFLSGAVSTGQNAAAMTGNAGSNMANAVGGNTTALGNAQGASQIAQGNAWNSGINNGIGAYQGNQLMNKILSGNSGWGSTSADAWRTTGNGMPSGFSLE